MKLAINGRFLAQPVTGVQRYARELVRAMDADRDVLPGWSIELLTPRGIPHPAFERITVRATGRMNGHRWEQLELPRAVTADVLFCPGNTAPIISLLGGPPVVTTVHDLSYLYFPDAYSRMFRLAYNIIVPVALSRSARLITVSESERAAIGQRYPNTLKRMTAVANGNATPEVAAGVPTEIAKLGDYVLYVGSFSRRKNYPRVIAAARRLLEARPNLRFVLIGGTPAVFDRIDASALLHNRMVFIGQVDDAERLTPYYRSAKALIFPSLYESSGLPPTEAMANGCPVVASDIPALRERCGDAALFCNPTDVSSIVQAVDRILDTPSLSDVLVAAGRTQATQFTWERCTEQTAAIIAAAAGG